MLLPPPIGHVRGGGPPPDDGRSDRRGGGRRRRVHLIDPPARGGPPLCGGGGGGNVMRATLAAGARGGGLPWCRDKLPLFATVHSYLRPIIVVDRTHRPGIRGGRQGTRRGGSEGRSLTREGAGFGCYQHGSRGGCDQHVATAMTTSVEGRCSLVLREVLHMATTAAGSTGRRRDAFFRRDDDNCSQKVSYFYPFGG
jgi:hypothetical protein